MAIRGVLYSKIPLICHPIKKELRKVVLKQKFCQLKITVHVFPWLYLQSSVWCVPITNFVTEYDMPRFCKLVLSHTLMALQATSGSHHLFGTLNSMTVNSTAIVLYVVCATLYSSYYNGFKRSNQRWVNNVMVEREKT